MITSFTEAAAWLARREGETSWHVDGRCYISHRSPSGVVVQSNARLGEDGGANFIEAVKVAVAAEVTP